MDTFQLYNVLKSDKAIRQIFYGVYPIDKLPILTSKPAAIIVNLDTSKQPGSHWVCMFFDAHDRCSFFDSYGRSPCISLADYMNQYAAKIEHNTKCVQGMLSATCGQLCVYFLVWRVRGISLKEIVKSLEKSFADEFVTGFVNNLFKINTVSIDANFIVQQLCKKGI